MSGRIRVRFAGQQGLLAAWESAANVVAAPKLTDTKPSASGTSGAGEVKPAA